MTDQIIHRDTITGQTVTAEYAKAHPDTTVRETRRAGKWRRRAEAAEAKLDAVRALHASSGDEESQGYLPGGGYGYISPYCVGCEAFDEYAVAWPCATIRAIDGTEETWDSLAAYESWWPR